MFMSVYVYIYKYMQVYAILSSYIRVYMGIYAYIQNFKQFEKVCITAGFEPVISCILSAGVTTALLASTVTDTSVLLFPFTGPIHIRLSALLFPVTWRLVSDVGRGTRGAARAGHDIAGPGLHLEVLVLAAACQ